MLISPFITLIMSSRRVPADLAVKMAIATSMATIMFTSISSVRAHHQRGAVRWPIVQRLAPGIVLGGVLASVGVFALLKGTTLALVFALFVGFSATQMFLDKKPKPSRQMPGAAGTWQQVRSLDLSRSWWLPIAAFLFHFYFINEVIKELKIQSQETMVRIVSGFRSSVLRPSTS